MFINHVDKTHHYNKHPSTKFLFSVARKRSRHQNFHLCYEFPCCICIHLAGLPDFNDVYKEPNILKRYEWYFNLRCKTALTNVKKLKTVGVSLILIFNISKVKVADWLMH